MQLQINCIYIVAHYYAGVNSQDERQEVMPMPRNSHDLVMQ